MMWYNITESQTSPRMPNIIRWFLMALATVLMAAYLSACYTPKKAKKQAIKAMLKHPMEVLPALRQIAPCVTIKVDTVVSNHDTTILIDCPDSLSTIYHTDTITGVKEVYRTVKVPVKVQIPGKTLIKYVRDSAEIIECNFRNMELGDELAEAENKIKAIEEKLAKITKTRNWLWLILLAIGVWTFRNTFVRAFTLINK